jgi:hypothetical protein
VWLQRGDIKEVAEELPADGFEIAGPDKVPLLGRDHIGNRRIVELKWNRRHLPSVARPTWK